MTNQNSKMNLRDEPRERTLIYNLAKSNEEGI
jgi:hypothetical protein